MKERVLCIAAHTDDESFGCLGTLLQHKKAGDVIELLALTSARDTLNGFVSCAKHLDAVFSILNYKDQEFDTYPLKKIISDIECWVKVFRPTIVYCPFIEDLNRDHRIIAEATMVGCRPYLPNAPKKVWMYKIAGTTELGFKRFHCDKSVMIDAEKKEELIRLWYPSEMIHGREKIEAYEPFEMVWRDKP